MAKRSERELAALFRDFRDWLATEGMVKDDASIGIFAMRMTNYGRHAFHGYTEKGICNALGGDPYYTD